MVALKMHFPRYCCVSSVPVYQSGGTPPGGASPGGASPEQSSCTTFTIRFSAALRLLALIAMDGVYVCFAGAKKLILKKSLFLETPKGQS